MEFMQFHPDVLYIAVAVAAYHRSDARRGGPARRSRRLRFMADYDSRGELARADVVSQAIVSQMEKTRHPNVYLDLSHLDAQRVRSRFSRHPASCAEFGIDITKDRIPVRPGAHYMIGGVSVVLRGRTAIPGLWAAGEVTSTGLHARIVSRVTACSKAWFYGAHTAKVRVPKRPSSTTISVSNRTKIQASKSTAARRSTCRHSQLATEHVWRDVGVRREGDARRRRPSIDQWCRYVLRKQFNVPKVGKLQNMLTVARLMIYAAKQRNESRGVHFRTDFPKSDDQRWKRHIAFHREA